MEELNLKCYAHLGDAVYEVFIREKVVMLTSKMSRMHKLNTALVRASFQCELLNILDPHLTEKEQDLIRRGRNLPLGTAKKRNQTLHHMATGFEVLVGYLHMHDHDRLLKLFKIMSDYINSKDHIVNE